MPCWAAPCPALLPGGGCAAAAAAGPSAAAPAAALAAAVAAAAAAVSTRQPACRSIGGSGRGSAGEHGWRESVGGRPCVAGGVGVCAHLVAQPCACACACLPQTPEPSPAQKLVAFKDAFWKFLRPHTIRGTILGSTAVTAIALLENTGVRPLPLPCAVGVAGGGGAGVVMRAVARGDAATSPNVVVGHRGQGLRVPHRPPLARPLVAAADRLGAAAARGAGRAGAAVRQRLHCGHQPGGRLGAGRRGGRVHGRGVGGPELLAWLLPARRRHLHAPRPASPPRLQAAPSPTLTRCRFTTSTSTP